MKRKVVLSRQHDERDCGAACLKMIAAFFGREHTLPEMLELTKTDKTGTSLFGIIDGAEQLGLSAEALQGSPEELMDAINRGEVTFPFIAHTVADSGSLHFVVIDGAKRNTFFVKDPGKGSLQMTYDDFFRCWTGCIAVFSKTDAFHARRKRQHPMVRFLLLMKSQIPRLAAVLALSILISAIGVAGSYLFQAVIDGLDMNGVQTGSGFVAAISMFLSANRAHLSTVFGAVIAMYLLQGLISFSRGVLIAKAASLVDMNLSQTYCSHLLELPLQSISQRQTGEYISRFSDADAIRAALSGAAVSLTLDVVMVVVCGWILAAQSVRLFFVSLLMLLLYAVVFALYRRPLECANREIMSQNAQVQSYLKQSVDGIETLKAGGAIGRTDKAMRGKLGCFAGSVRRGSVLSAGQEAIVSTIDLIGTTCVLWAGFSLVYSGGMSVGALITYYALLGFFTEPVKHLIALQPTIQSAAVAADRMNDVLDLSTEEPTTERKKTSMGTVRRWELQNLVFRYGNQEAALKDVSLSFQRGERIAIVGETASGKTTLAKLLMGFYRPQSGTIRADGTELSDFSIDTVRENIAYVSQHTFLLADTIRNNLCLGNPDASDEEIARICALCRLNDFISSQPLGLDTPLDENGMNLSGGQRQRLAIARALLQHPQLLILDEATSNLDTITERAIQDMIFSLPGGMTCIMIAHRLSTIRLCDRIYLMDAGRIIESGTHEELMQSSARYQALFRAMAA